MFLSVVKTVTFNSGFTAGVQIYGSWINNRNGGTVTSWRKMSTKEPQNVSERIPFLHENIFY